MLISNLSIWVIITFIFQIAVNAYYGSSIGEVSKNNPTYLTPDGITFIIWTFIYLFQFLLVIYQYNNPTKLIENARLPLILAFISNGIWCIFWYYNYWWVQFADILIYLLSLIVLYNIIVQRYTLSWYTVFSHFAISANLPWCLFASVISLTVALQNNGYMPTETWAITWIILITVISNILVISKFDFIFGLVTTWALSGIYRNQNEENTSLPLIFISENIYLTSLICLTITGCMTILFFIFLLFLKYILKYN
jgi:hypothetical protein